jgi:carbamoyl-phosphate synthase large subunit
MQSTGEVIGIHEDPRVALAKALRGAGLLPSAAATSATDGRRPLAAISIADRDKPQLLRLATALDRAGFRFAATDGTRAALLAAGFDADPVSKLSAFDASGAAIAGAGVVRDVVGLIESGEVRLVVNTPTPRSGAVRDAAEIRISAIEEGVPCLTAMETAVAAAEALDPAIDARVADVRSIGEWLAMLPDRAPQPPIDDLVLATTA